MTDPISDQATVRAILLSAAREHRAMSYSELLGCLGHRFTRPKMRALCRTLEAIDKAGSAAGEPGLAVLVVREADGLPGQGWWAGGGPSSRRHQGSWTGPEAKALVSALQTEAFDYWTSH